MQIEQWELSRVIPYPGNPRLNEAAVDPVAESIRAFGFRQPIVVDLEGVIIAGHTRRQAAQKLKLQTVPVLVAGDLTPEQVRAYRLADNKTGEIATWNLPELKIELNALAIDFNVDMTDFGFSNDDIEWSNDSPEVEDAIDKSEPVADKPIPNLYQVVVECKDEDDQKLVFEELTQGGRKCKLLCL